jgi:transcription elongation factor S-II
MIKVIENPTEFRNNVTIQLAEYLKKIGIISNDYNKLGKNFEKGIYNSCISDAGKKSIVKKWDNEYFVHIYIDKLRSIYLNINSKYLIDLINSNQKKIHEIAFMTHQEMFPERWRLLIDEKKIRDENKYTIKIEASTDNFTCWKCKSKKCTYYQLQTRSADEPMTTFVTCLSCGQRWRC